MIDVPKKITLGLALCGLLLARTGDLEAAQGLPGEETRIYESNAFTLGVGWGIVNFDTNVKVTTKLTGRSRFIDLEGNLGLPDNDRVGTIYGGYRFNEKHALVFGYFAINRESELIDYSEEFNDLVLVEANVSIEDNSEFYNIGYAYNLFRDPRSSVNLVVGLNNLDLKLEAEASGKITVGDESLSVAEVADADVLAPLPLIGLNFGFGFTPQWSVSTRVALVTGSYDDVSADVAQVTINSLYRFNQHAGLLLGLSYFDAQVDIDDDDDLTEVVYSYSGAFIGLHIGI